MIGAGIQIEDFPFVAIYRIIPKNYDIRGGWDKAPRPKNESRTIEIVENVSSELSEKTRTIKSSISAKGNIWCFAAQDREIFEDYLSILQFEISKEDLIAYPALFQEYNPLKSYVKRPTKVYGWTKGSLFDALTLIGVSNCQTDYIDKEKDLFNYPKKIKDFNSRILPSWIENIDTDDSVVLYIKEPSNASRKMNREDKFFAIDFLDFLVKQIFDNFEESNTNLFFLTDHQSNIGIERTYTGATIFAFGNILKRNNSDFNFSEKNIRINNDKVITQETLIEKIENSIKT